VTTPFQDQREFMTAFGQSVTGQNSDQYILYNNLITEEVKELYEAMKEVQDAGEKYQSRETDIPAGYVMDLVRATGHVAKEAMDVIVVLTGYLLSMGVSPELAWKAVHESNMAKLDPETGKPIYRKDGKVQKPTSWRAPDMDQVVFQSWRPNDD
jgi:predicted HAD superfamily Cof-like phosphohydrolase